jgi:hypothetical protein
MLTPGFSINTLVGNIGKATRTAVSLAEIHANALTNGNTMQIAYNPYESMNNDIFSTLIHEGFHLAMSSAGGGNLKHEQMYKAVEAASGIKYQGGEVGVYIKQIFGDECGKP